MPSYAYFLLPASLAALALAKTDLTGCTSTDVSSPAGASLAWYVPGTGELCDFLDCGGGRAPPKTDVPGCPQYSGTSTYSPSYMPGWGSTAAAAASSSVSQASETTSSVAWSALETDTASGTWDLYTTAPPAAYSSSAWSSITATAAASNISAVSSAFASASASAYSSWSSAVAHNGTMVTVTGTANGTAIGGHSTAAVNSTMLLSVTASASGSSRATITSIATASATGSTAGGAASATTSGQVASNTSAVNAAASAKAWVGAGLVMGLGAIVVAL